MDVAGSLGIVAALAALAARLGPKNVLGLRIIAAYEHSLQPEPLILSRQPRSPCPAGM